MIDFNKDSFYKDIYWKNQDIPLKNSSYSSGIFNATSTRGEQCGRIFNNGLALVAGAMIANKFSFGQKLYSLIQRVKLSPTLDQIAKLFNLPALANQTNALFAEIAKHPQAPVVMRVIKFTAVTLVVRKIAMTVVMHFVYPAAFIQYLNQIIHYPKKWSHELYNWRNTKTELASGDEEEKYTPLKAITKPQTDNGIPTRRLKLKPKFVPTAYKTDSQKVVDHFSSQGLICKRITLEKLGRTYNAWLVGEEKTINNKNWVLIAGGNCDIGEDNKARGEIALKSHYDKLTKKLDCKENQPNFLYVDGPTVGGSSGLPTSHAIGDAQEAGMQFLENAMKAKKIFAYGHSLGGGSQAEMILKHQFKQDVKYMVWSDRTFGTLSGIAGSIVPFLAPVLFYLLGIELNVTAAAKRLKELNITHVVTQHASKKEAQSKTATNGDEVIPDHVSLSAEMIKEKVEGDSVKIFTSDEVDHMNELPNEIINETSKLMTDFFSK